MPVAIVIMVVSTLLIVKGETCLLMLHPGQRVFPAFRS